MANNQHYFLAYCNKTNKNTKPIVFMTNLGNK